MLAKRMRNQISRSWFFFIKSRNKKSFYRISGMRRSGNHALIIWILKQLPGATCYNNNMGPFHPPENTIIKKIALRGFSQFNLLVSLEDKWCKDAFQDYDSIKFGESEQKHTILILRDPYNMFASRWVWKDEFGRLFREDPEHQRMIIDIWKEHARTFLDWKNSSEDLPSNHKLGINYNLWFVDKEYRRQIAEKLHLRFTDAGKDDVSNYGFGSSFTGRDLHKKGSQLKVLDRWKSTLEDSAYCDLFLDKELRDLSREIFGMEDVEKAIVGQK